MKRKLTILLLLLVCPVLLADLIKLTWDMNDPGQRVLGYNVYEKSGTNWVRVGITTNTLYILDVIPGAHTFSVTATNFWRESPFLRARLDASGLHVAGGLNDSKATRRDVADNIAKRTSRTTKTKTLSTH